MFFTDLTYQIYIFLDFREWLSFMGKISIGMQCSEKFFKIWFPLMITCSSNLYVILLFLIYLPKTHELDVEFINLSNKEEVNNFL